MTSSATHTKYTGKKTSGRQSAGVSVLHCLPELARMQLVRSYRSKGQITSCRQLLSDLCFIRHKCR